MDSNHKIDKINAYRKLLETKRLPKVDPEADKGVESEITEEFEVWAKGQISALLGEPNPKGLTDEEIEFLKQFVAKAQHRATNPAPAPVAPVAAVAPQSDAQNAPRITNPARPNPNAKPIRERGPNSALLNDLDRMEERASKKDF